jgi:hypothetical protein
MDGEPTSIVTKTQVTHEKKSKKDLRKGMKLAQGLKEEYALTLRTHLGTLWPHF